MWGKNYFKKLRHSLARGNPLFPRFLGTKIKNGGPFCFAQSYGAMTTIVRDDDDDNGGGGGGGDGGDGAKDAATEGTPPRDERRPSRAAAGGARVRRLLLVALAAAAIYVAFRGVASSSPRSVYVCDVPERDTGYLRECSSPYDVASCAGLPPPSDSGGGDGGDVGGGGGGPAASRCVLSSCGYKLLPHVEVSVAGTSDPLDPDAAPSPTSFLSVASVFYGLVPYFGALYLMLFLGNGDIVHLTRLFVWGMIAVLNSKVFKPLFDQKRPMGSCLYFETYGMPR